MILVKLTGPGGEPAYINPEYVVLVVGTCAEEMRRNKKTRIETTVAGSHSIYVKESAEVVAGFMDPIEMTE